VNQFGNEGGFDELQKRIKAVATVKGTAPNFGAVSKIIRLISKLKPLLESGWLSEYIKDMTPQNIVKPAIDSLDEKGVRSLETADITNLGKDIKSLLSGVKGTKEKELNKFVEETELEVIKILLGVDQLPKQMDALNSLGNIIRALEPPKSRKWNYNFLIPSILRGKPTGNPREPPAREEPVRKLHWITDSYFLEWLKTEKIVDKILQPNNHDMVLKLSVPILKYLAANGRLDDHLKKLTNLLAGADEETSKILSSAIADVAEKLPENEVKGLFATFTNKGQKKLSEYTVSYIKLIADFTRSAIKGNGGKGSMYGADLFWEMLQSGNRDIVTPQCRKVALESLMDLFVSDTIKDCSEYMKRCVKNLRKGLSVVICLKLLKLMLETGNRKETSKAILKAEAQHSLLEIFFDDYRSYNEAAATKYDNLVRDGVGFSDEKTILHGDAPHSQQVAARLSFLRFLIQNSTLALTIDQVDALWTVCVTESVTPEDISQFMRWLSDCMSGKAEKLYKPLPKDKERQIFEAFDSKSSAGMFSKLEKSYVHKRTNTQISVTPEWYSCFADTFKSTNMKNGALNKKGRVAMYDKLLGKNALWEFALREKDLVVRQQAQKFLVSQHLKLEVDMKQEDKKHVLKGFLDSCVRELKDALSGNDVKQKKQLTLDSVMTVLEQLVRRVSSGEMVFRPLFEVGEKVKASWKKPATENSQMYNAKVMKINEDEGQITYSLYYADGDKDPQAKESYIRTMDGKKKERPPLELSEAEMYPEKFLSGAVEAGKVFLDLAISTLETGGSAANKTWKLLTRLPYNKQALEEVGKLPYEKKEFGRLLPENAVKLLYTLTILNPQEENSPLNDTNWCMHFVQDGALTHMVKVFESLDPKTIIVNDLPRLCLSKILDVTSFFLVMNEGHIRVSAEDVVKAIDISKLLDLCLKYMPLAPLDTQGKAVQSLLTTAVICTRISPSLISRLPTAGNWAEIFKAALITNDITEVQVAFTRGIADLCEHTTSLPDLFPKKSEDDKSTGKSASDAKEDEKDGEDGDKNKGEDKKSAAEKVEDLEFHLDTHRLFNVLDVDKNKLLDAKELSALFHGGRPFPPGVADGVDEFIEKADVSKDGKISFEELANFFKEINLTSDDLIVTYGRLNDIKREKDAEACNAMKLRQDVRSHFLPILLAEFKDLDTSKDCAQFLMLMGEMIRQTESIEEKEATRIAQSLAGLIKQHPMRERNSGEEDAVLGALMRLTGETVNKAPFLRDQFGVNGSRQLSLLSHTVDCLFAIPEEPKLDTKTALKSPKSRGDTGLHPPKAKHPNSRASAFHLLLALVRNHDSNLGEVIRLLCKNHFTIHNDGKKPDLWDFEPPRDVEERGSGFVGLRNCGNTCYINAALQQLFMMKRLRKELLRVDGYDKEKSALLFGFQWLMSHLQESSSRAIVPKTFLDNYIDPATGKPVRAPGSGSRQDDSFAFFQTLLSRLEDETKGTAFHKTVEKMLGIGECTEMIGAEDTPYLSDHTAKHRNRIATSIGVNVKNCTTLEECLHNYVKGEMITGYSGAADPGLYGQKYPGQKITILKRTSFKSLPNTLAIGLNRMEFAWDDRTQNMVGRKLVHRVAFPFVLDMKPYCIDSLQTPQGYRTGSPAEAELEKSMEGDSKGGGSVPDPEARTKALQVAVEERKKSLGLPERKDSYYKYRLMGVVVHSGQTLNSGHYYSFIRERPKLNQITPPKDGEEGARWFCFNDSSVTAFNPNRLAEETFGAVDGSWKSATAYVLVYEREVLEAEVAADTKTVSTEILQRIWHENRVRVRDQNVYNKPYFLFVENLMKYLLKQFPTATASCQAIKTTKDVTDKPIDHYDAAARLILRFMCMTLARSAYREVWWEQIVEGAEVILANSIPTATWFLSMLLHPVHNWLSMMMNAKPSSVRGSTARLLAAAARTVSPLEADSYSTDAKHELKGSGEVLEASTGYVVQIADRLLSLLDRKSSADKSVVMESLASFASLGKSEAGYLQKENILQAMLEHLVSPEAEKRNLADSVFTLLNTVREDIREGDVKTLLSPQTLGRLLIEPYSVKRAKPVVSLLRFLCTPEGVEITVSEPGADCKIEARRRLNVILSAIGDKLTNTRLNCEVTRPLWRVLRGLTEGNDSLAEGRKWDVFVCVLAAIRKTIANGEISYRRVDFYTEHLLRILASDSSVADLVKKDGASTISELIKFFGNYPNFASTLGESYFKPEVERDQVDSPYHQEIVHMKHRNAERMGFTYTITSRYAEYGRPIKKKIEDLKLLLEGSLQSSDPGYDSDEERLSRKLNEFKVGQRVDVLDTVRKWLPGVVQAVKGNMLDIHYIKCKHTWDEYIEYTSARICTAPDTLSKAEESR